MKQQKYWVEEICKDLLNLNKRLLYRIIQIINSVRSLIVDDYLLKNNQINYFVKFVRSHFVGLVRNNIIRVRTAGKLC